MILPNFLGRLLRQVRERARRQSFPEAARLLDDGLRQQRSGDHERARENYERVLAGDPDNADAHYLLGMAHAECQRLEAAREHLLKATALKPDGADAHIDLGNVYRLLRDPAAAEASYRKALALAPDSALAYSNLARLLKEEGDREQAQEYLRRAHLLAPDRGDILRSLVLTLLEYEHYDEAVNVAAAAAEGSPDSYEAQLCLGFAYQQTGAPVRALACYNTALRLRMDDAELHFNRAIALQDLGRLPEALASYDQALELRPDYRLARACRALAHLLVGDYSRGWADYEARLLRQDTPARPLSYARWDGAPLKGRTVLIYGEQGLGDEIMFASCLPQVMREAGHCVIECAPKLLPLFTRSFAEATVYAATPDRNIPPAAAARGIAVEVPIGSLPLYYRRIPTDFPAHDGYLIADAQRVAHWRARLEALGPGPKVGISWRGGTRRTRGEMRSIAIEQWLPILRGQRVRFVSLQYSGDAAREVAQLRDEHRVSIAHWPEAITDYEETAALVAALDLTISICTAVVHLAGALGKPVWIMAPYSPDWCFGFAGERMPWYATARVFRQEPDKTWQPVINRVARELAGVAAAGGSAGHVE